MLICLLRLPCQEIGCLHWVLTQLKQIVWRIMWKMKHGIGTWDLVIWKWKKKRWWKGCLQSIIPIIYVKHVFLANMERGVFQKKQIFRATKPLELVHIDVYGPINLPSLCKSKYFLYISDDLSRKFWVYFLKKKLEPFVALKNFKTLVEEESRYNIKSLRFDRGSEFTSKEFNDFCETHGIIVLWWFLGHHNGMV